MTVSPTLQKYLDQSVTYDLIPHVPTMSSTRTAEACHVPGEALAKAVVLRRDGGYMMAVLPASHHLHLSALKSQLGHHVDLASEKEIAEIREREPAVDDVLDDHDVTVGDVDIEIFDQTHGAGRSRRRAVARHRDDVVLDWYWDRACEVGEEDECAFQHTDEKQPLARVLAGQLLAEFVDAFTNGLLAEYESTELVMVLERHERRG